MEGFFIGITGAVIGYVILYFVIKAAVRNGIVEARRMRRDFDETAGNDNSISQKTCPGCGKKHDIDFPKCPYCNYQY